MVARFSRSFLAVLLAFLLALFPFCLRLGFWSSHPVIIVEQSQAHANPIAIGAAFTAIVAAVTGVAITATTLDYDSFKSYAASNGYSSAASTLDDAIENLRNYGSVPLALCVSCIPALGSWLVANNALSSSSSASVPVSNQSTTVFGIPVLFGAMLPGVDWSDDSSWCVCIRETRSDGTFYQQVVYSSDNLWFSPYSDTFISSGSVTRFNYNEDGSFKSSGFGSYQIILYNRTTTNWIQSTYLNPNYSGIYYFSDGAGHAVSYQQGTWSDDAFVSVTGGDTVASEVEGYPVSRNTSDMDQWLSDLQAAIASAVGSAITVPTGDSVTSWDQVVDNPSVVVPEGINSLSKSDFLDYVRQLVAAGVISISAALALVDAYCAANSLSVVDSIPMQITLVSVFAAALALGFDGWSIEKPANGLKNLPWGNVWPYCYVYDLKDMLETLNSSGAWDYHLRWDFSDSIQSFVPGADLSFDFDMSEWLPAFKSTVRGFFLATFTFGLLWFSISIWLRTPSQGGDSRGRSSDAPRRAN